MSEEKEPRRRFLRQVVTIVPVTALAGGVTATISGPASSKTEKTATQYSPTYFTAAEWAFIHAAVDHLIPSDQFGPGALGTGVPEFLDRQMETPYGHGKLWYMQGPFHTDLSPLLGYQLNLTPREIYRHGIADSNAWCQKHHGKRFADLTASLQESILKDIEGGKIQFDSVPAKTFFSYLLKNTKEGYFADPVYGGNKDMAGWKMLGFPGARADYADWIGQHDVKYPYGPVSISGKKG